MKLYTIEGGCKWEGGGVYRLVYLTKSSARQKMKQEIQNIEKQNEEMFGDSMIETGLYKEIHPDHWEDHFDYIKIIPLKLNY